MRTVQEFERAGVAGIHIEDQVFPKRASYHRGLEHVVPLDEFLRRLEYALKARRDKDFMIFARTDAGNAAGGLFYGDYIVGSQLGAAIVFGRIAAVDACARAQ